IDCLLIFQNIIYIFEVKNFEGDFYIDDDKWYVVSSGSEIRNPLHQIRRSEVLFRQLLQQLGYNICIKFTLVFVNQEFHLYHSPMNQSITSPNQLLRFTKKLNNITGKITNNHIKVAGQLSMRHILNSPHERLPEFTYEELKKGIVCRVCDNFL